MKDSFKAALFLLLFTLILLIVFIGGYALYLASGFSMISMEIGAREFIAMLSARLPLFLPLTLTLSFFFTFLRLKNRPGFRILTFILLFSVSWGILWTSGFFLSPEKVSDIQHEARSPLSFEAGKIHILTGGRQIYIGSVKGDEFLNMASPREEDGSHYLDFFPRGTLAGNAISARDRRGEIQELVLMDAKNADAGHPLRIAAFPLYSRTSAEDDSSGASRIFNDFSMLGRALLSLRNQEPLLVYFFSICAFSLYLVSCWGFIRISRWPLFNAVIVLFLLFGAGSLYRIFSDDMFAPLTELLLDKTMGIPPAVLVLAGSAVILILVDLLFIPYKKRIEEEENE